MNTIKLYKRGNKINSSYTLDSINFSTADLYKILRDDLPKDFKFISVKEDNKDITYYCLFNVLAKIEKDNDNKIDLNRVIRSGGYLSYIRELELGILSTQETFE